MDDYQNLNDAFELKKKDLSELDCYLKALVDGMVLGQVIQAPDRISNPDLQESTLNLFNSVSDFIYNYNDLKKKLTDSQNQVRMKLCTVE